MGFVMLLITLLIYVTPMLVAHRRNHANFSAIAAFNLLAGWTVIGWIISLVWAMTNNVKAQA